MEQISVEVNENQEWKKRVLEFSEEHKYVISHVDIFGACGDTIGDIFLKNVITNEVEEYAIWIADDDLSLASFYVCLPTSVDEDLNEVHEDYSLDEFEIPRHYYSNLEWL